MDNDDIEAYYTCKVLIVAVQHFYC